MNNRKGETRTEMKGFDITIEVSGTSLWPAGDAGESCLSIRRYCLRVRCWTMLTREIARLFLRKSTINSPSRWETFGPRSKLRSGTPLAEPSVCNLSLFLSFRSYGCQPSSSSWSSAVSQPPSTLHPQSPNLCQNPRPHPCGTWQLGPMTI